MRKGIVLEVDKRFLTLLTPEGEFLKARKQKQDYIIGQEIDFFPISESPKRKSLFYYLPGKALTAALFAVMVASASFLSFNGRDNVYAYMSIDVNPSLELAVNDELEVVKLNAYNSEGKQILSELEGWKHQDVSTVTTKIIDEIKEQGFFKKHDEILISTVYEEKKKEKLDKKLEANIEAIEGEVSKENLHVTVVQATKNERKKAHKEGITTGIYKEKHKNKEQIQKPQELKDGQVENEKIRKPQNSNHNNINNNKKENDKKIDQKQDQEKIENNKNNDRKEVKIDSKNESKHGNGNFKKPRQQNKEHKNKEEKDRMKEKKEKVKGKNPAKHTPINNDHENDTENNKKSDDHFDKNDSNKRDKWKDKKNVQKYKENNGNKENKGNH